MAKNKPDIDEEKTKKSHNVKQEERGLELLDMLDQALRKTHARMTLTEISNALMFLAEKRHYSHARLAD